MTDEDLERLLRESFDARARASVRDDAVPPAPRYASGPVAPRRRRVATYAPIAAAAVVVAVVALVVAITRSGASHRTSPVAGSGPSTTAAPSPDPAPDPSSTESAAQSVHISLANAEGATYGVGMPVIAYFSKRITNARALQAATQLTVNGKPMTGAWYFQTSASKKGPIEGHLRPQSFWPAHARIHVALSARGVTAGPGLAFGNDIALDFTTGAANISTVDDATHRITVTRDGKRVLIAPVSLGAKNTPTQSGVKVVMEKGDNICMTGPGYDECHIKYTQRLTYGGEYLHSAPWNAGNIKRGVDTSNGCTNLLPADAKRLYSWAQVGDIVQYPDAAGPRMSLGSGYGDWNVPWSTWTRGGLVPTS